MEEITKALTIYNPNVNSNFYKTKKQCWLNIYLNHIFVKRRRILFGLLAIYVVSFFLGSCILISNKFPIDVSTFCGNKTIVIVVLTAVSLSGYTVFGKFAAVFTTILIGFVNGMLVFDPVFSTSGGELGVVLSLIIYAFLGFLILVFTQELYVYSEKAFKGSLELFRFRPISIHFLFTLSLSVLIYYIAIFLYNN